MPFVPASLFACLCLLIALSWFARKHDLTQRAHQLFFAVIVLYAVQSLLLTLRWGYGIEPAGRLAAFTAPVLPVIAYLSYRALSARLGGRRLWPLAAVAVNWIALSTVPEIGDTFILVTYLGLGGLLIGLARTGADRLALSPLGEARAIAIAMAVTGITLVASGLMDIDIITDFIRHEGRNVGLIVGVLQSAFVLITGLCAAFGRIATAEMQDDPAPAPDRTTDEDDDIVTRIEALFETEKLHRDEELSLRRLSRRLSLPDRQVSNATNRRRGQSVSQFVNEHRIRVACTLLATTSDTVLAISLAAGFSSKSNFNREFARVTGATPSQWRRSQSGDTTA